MYVAVSSQINRRRTDAAASFPLGDLAPADLKERLLSAKAKSQDLTMACSRRARRRAWHVPAIVVDRGGDVVWYLVSASAVAFCTSWPDVDYGRCYEDDDRRWSSIRLTARLQVGGTVEIDVCGQVTAYLWSLISLNVIVCLQWSCGLLMCRHYRGNDTYKPNRGRW